MSIVTTKCETADRGGGGIHNSQGRRGKEAVTKSGEISLDLTGNMSVDILKDSTLEGGDSYHKESMEGVLQF